MKKQNLVAAALMMAFAIPVMADVNKDNLTTTDTTKIIKTPAGNTLEVNRLRQNDGEGNLRGKTKARLTDEDGNEIARGMNAGRKLEDGSGKRVKKREWTDDEGNTYQKRARARGDGEGNRQGQRQGRRFNQDGEITARGRDRGYRLSDGSGKRRSQKQWKDSDGNAHNKKRKKKK